MPSALDLVLIGVMLISALLAMIRGFMREILSIAAWISAAAVAIYAYYKLVPIAKPYLNISSDMVATGVVVLSAFLGTLLIVTVITVQFSDMVLDSRVGALDRTLGFLFGLGRGLLIVTVAYMFFVWLVPNRQPAWIADAKSKTVLQGTGEWLISMSPDIEAWYEKYKKQRQIDAEPPDTDAPPAGPPAAPGQRSELRAPAGAAG